MKKLLIGMVAALCCLALAAPVMAEIQMGGMVTVDVSYNKISSEAITPGATAAGAANWGTGVQKSPVATTNYYNGFSEFNILPPQTQNRLNMKYTSDDKTVGAFIELRGGGANYGSLFEWTYGWIDWRPTKEYLLRIGRQTTTFAPYVPNQFLGTHVTTILGVGFGNLNHTTSRDGIKSYYKFNDMVAWEISMWDNHTVATSTAAPFVAGDAEANYNAQTGKAVILENTIPRFDMSLPITVGNFKIEPSVTWSKMNYEQVKAGYDDSFDIWGLSLGGTATFGPFTFTGEITYGENFGNGSYRGGETALVALYTDAGGLRKIADAEYLGWFIDLTFKITPSVSISGYYGWQKASCDGGPGAWDAAEYENTRWMAGVRLPIFITKNFSIAPEFTYYDYDSNADVGSVSTGVANGVKTTWDMGNEWLLGVEFQLTF